MFWWFQRDGQFVRYEARTITAGVYELVERLADGTEVIERFTSESALKDRERALIRELDAQGWTGPHGWNL
jgi:hypothetical protein